MSFQSGPSKGQLPALFAGGLERRAALEHLYLGVLQPLADGRRPAVADAIATQVPPPQLRQVRLRNCCELSDEVVGIRSLVDKKARAVTQTVLGPKEQKIISLGEQGVVEVEVDAADRQASSLSAEMLAELIDAALKIE
eukprot:SAG22_NODE_8604_length_642_cov_0.882136_1_plen_138_part_10